MAAKFLKGNITRAMFPLLAVVIGAMTLIMTLSLGDGAKNIINKDLSAIGGNRILLGDTTLTKRDLELMERLPFVEYAVFPEERVLINNTLFRGYSKKALLSMNLPILKDNEVVLDKIQFPNGKVGDTIDLETKLGKRKFTIRDYYQEESPFETMRMGNRVIVSDETFERIFGRSNYNSLVVSFPQDEDGEEYIPVVLRELNRSRFSYSQVRVLETPAVYKKVERIKSFVGKSLFILSFISLIVGGAGILNLIAAAVRERTSYIGILRTVGMDKRSLMEIFLIEAAVVITLGAIIGIILGVAVSYLAGNLLKIPPYFNFLKMVGALVLTMGVGLIFGVFPAKRAGELEIVEALKI
ncbi:ABC transporter permease [Candidatus Cetobacterium colombiensis]|uniref:FtsX-like permease family protein n=1 Tax=Candidatus Cetobacterium colombiensis TaxID=3073100 RepID=A0ABU4WDP4_9FUSO|nr:FtsX-like permease family protein [Candidatus Cetobacterium colombiensis]MDX8337147.1 FtsX-like permease family protein [Candidatus Cetobacterium colombiensis]